jgi:hypothetical protein
MALFNKEYIIMIFEQHAYKLTTSSAITCSVFIKTPEGGSLCITLTYLIRIL